MAIEDEFKKANVTAVTSLAAATSSATEFGFTQVAQAGEKVQYVLIKIFQAAPAPEAIAQQDVQKFQERVRELERQIADLPAARTESFRCQQDFEECVARARKNGTSQVTCWVSYAACLGAQLTTLMQKN